MSKVFGGKAVYGASIGILMLEARFPRIPGDMGNALTWPFPVLYKVVRDASPDRVVRRAAEGLYEQFAAAARELIADGADAITTNCGFLCLYQQRLAADLAVPVATSSLLQIPWITQLLPPGKRPGILTISKASLTKAHLQAAGLAADIPIEGTENGREFTRAILDGHDEMDIELARQDNLEAAQMLLSNHRDIGAIVLECTNMIPYAADIAKATGLPVYSAYTLVNWLHASLVPHRFPAA